MQTSYETREPARAEIDTLPGPTVIEFGSPGCGWCRAAQPLIAATLDARPEIRHLKIADGPGRPLGRSFRVKLWPTLVFLRDGAEVARVVRPADAAELQAAATRVGEPPA